MIVDRRLTGETAENIFLSLLNQRGVFATSFDTEGLDGIAFDPDHRIFTAGSSPCFVQIKCRGSNTSSFNARGFPYDRVRKIEAFAQNLDIPYDSLYFVVGFYKEGDVRTVKYFGIPFASLDRFGGAKGWYNFSAKTCEAAMREDGNVFSV